MHNEFYYEWIALVIYPNEIFVFASGDTAAG